MGIAILVATGIGAKLPGATTLFAVKQSPALLATATPPRKALRAEHTVDGQPLIGGPGRLALQQSE
jgi:hypothetical protein